MKKIWLCGASGLLGAYLKRLLAQRQISFIAHSQQEMDITNFSRVADFVRTQKISHIMNCAAYTQVDRAEQEQQKAYAANAIGPHYLGMVGKRYGARVLHFSTDYVFDGKSQRPYTEEDPCSPIGVYGKSKWIGEIKLLEEYPHACIIRTSWLFGLPGRNFVETMLQLMSKQEHVRVVSDQIGRPTYCQDLAEVALEMLDEEGIFHFANAGETSWFAFAKEIYRQSQGLNFPLKTKDIEPISSDAYPTLAQRPLYSTLSTKKIESYLGRLPRPWQEALHDYLLHRLNDQKTAAMDCTYA